ncbi:MAG: glycogen synthase [Candidatus Kerfeldbacteria bacterium]|nr:glycogen synthase [Candidatus Kerfeldbacteria bacterium]
MNILFISAEATPLAKAGGLADVVGALPLALRKLGVDVRIMMPRYEVLGGNPILETIIERVPVEVGGQIYDVRVHRGRLPDSDVDVYLLENETFLSHGPIYNEHGQTDPFFEMQRFLFFSKAALTVIPELNWTPDILHCHDWHTGIVPSLASIMRGTVGMQTVVTIHNLAHQGVWKATDVLGFLGFSEKDHDRFALRDRRGDFNLLQQAIRSASVVNTVSPTYATEILTPEYGEGLEEELRSKQPPVKGILNGIDTTHFDPATDHRIRVQYDRTSIERKRENTLALHELCGFTPSLERMTFGFIGRLTEQKGVDLILQAQDAILKNGSRLIVLGTGMPEIEQALGELAKRYPDQVYCKLGFDAAFAQQLYAGSDALLMPSKFEPCGLGQMVAMRYGTIPIVRATGGLADTVPDVTSDPTRGLGFSFSPYEAAALSAAIDRAREYFGRPADWTALIQRCMGQDLSWERSARAYLKLYESISTLV